MSTQKEITLVKAYADMVVLAADLDREIPIMREVYEDSKRYIKAYELYRALPESED